MCFTLEDKFGDNGLICVIVLKKENINTLFIENWFMSCRVLNRGMENFVLNTLVDFAKKNKFKIIKGEYIPTVRNEIVKDHYINLGFGAENNIAILSLMDYKNKECFINEKINITNK